MKPSEALSTIRLLADETEEIERRASNYRFRLDRIMVTIDQGRSIVDAGREAAELLGLDRDEQREAPAMSVDPAPAAKPDDAPYGRRADGTPKARPGRKPTADVRWKGSLPAEAPRAGVDPLAPDERHNAALINAAAKAPVDEAKNAAELRSIRSALEGGPLTIGELVMNSGMSRPDVMRHLAAGAVIEEFTAARGEGLDPLPLVRLISQRPS